MITYFNFQTNPDEEEDIFSKNSRELQIKRQDSTGTNITIVKHELPNGTRGSLLEGAGSSGSQTRSKNWETFDEENSEISQTNNDVKQNWEQFDTEAEMHNEHRQKIWEKFEDDPKSPNTTKNARLRSSFEDTDDAVGSLDTTSAPTPLFSDTPVNNNTTYSYDILEQDQDVPRQPAVFVQPNIIVKSKFSSFQLLTQPTFYKSLLTVMTTKFSIFIFYTLFPVYLFQELHELKIREMSSLMGILSISNVLFSGVAYWVNVDKKRRPICMWLLCWLGSFGYFSKCT